MANIIKPYDPTVSPNAPDLHYYTSQATNGELKRLIKQNSDFNYTDFLRSDDQVKFFTDFIIEKANTIAGILLNSKMMYIKKELRNIDWFFLSKSGLLQDDFITLVLNKNWMIYNSLIDPYEAYYPIKIIHYLYPSELCRTHNLTKIVNNVYFDQNIFDEDSSSSDSNSSLKQTDDSLKGMLFEKILRLLHEDRIQYSKAYQEDLNMLTQNNNVTASKPNFLENASLYNSQYTIQNEDGSKTKRETCIYDDFVQFVKPSSTPTQNKSFYYMKRFSDNEYFISSTTSDSYTLNSYVGYDLTQPKPILSFETYDKKYMDLYHELTWLYTDNQDGSVSTSSILSLPKMYIADELRCCGLDRINLLKYQNNLPLEFVCRYYTMYQICKYYRFTSKQLYDNYDGLVITYHNENNTNKTPLDLKTLFMYNSFDMNDEYMIEFYNVIQQQVLNDSEIKNIINKYQRIYDKSDNIFETYSSLNSVNNSTSLAEFQEVFSSSSSTISTLEHKFPFSIDKFPYEINDKKSNYKIAESNGYIYNATTNTKGFIKPINNEENCSDNLLLTNISEANKKTILNQIVNKEYQYKPYQQYIYSIYEQYTEDPTKSIMQYDSTQKQYYINVCVSCQQQQMFFIDKGSAIQYSLKTAIPQKITQIIKENGSGWKNNEFVGDYYYPNNASCDNNGYIVCGNYHMMTEHTQCINVLKGIVYLKDIIAILENRLLACSKVKIVDNRIYYPTYEIYSPTSDATGKKLFIKEQKFI